MSSAAATTETAEPKKKRKKGGKLYLILFCLLAMGFLRVGFMFLIIGMLPAIVTSLFDRTAHRYMFKTVFCCNLAAMLPALGKMLSMGPSSSVVQDVMGDSMSWFIIYSSALGGFLLINIMPMLAQILVGGFHQTKVSQLIQTQQKIETEWGTEVTQFSKPEDGLR